MKAIVPAGGLARSLPATVERYTLLSYIGHGGMADIFLARETAGGQRGKLVAIKAVKHEHADKPRYVRMLRDESRVSLRIEHANVVRAERYVEHEGRGYLVMEYVESIDLRQLLRSCSARKLPLPLSLGLSIVRQVLIALDHVHRMGESGGRRLGVVHRDVSPSNVLVAFDGRVKLCDFGIAVSIKSGMPEGRETIEGKAGYMSPEHARGEAVDARADVFAVGVLLWELWCGRKLYKKRGSLSVIEQAARGLVAPLPVRGLPGEKRLHAIVRRALARDRADRYPDAQSMLRELDAWCLEHGMNAPSARLGRWLIEHFAEAREERRRMQAIATRFADDPIAEPAEAESGTRRVARHLPVVPDRRGSLELLAVALATFGAAFALLYGLGALGLW